MATPQSMIQQNIQNSVGTQTMAQNNVPVLGNNGNPFTIYNQAPAQGGYLPPVSSAFDRWRINPAPPPVDFGSAFGVGGGWGGAIGGGFPMPNFPLPQFGGGGWGGQLPIAPGTPLLPGPPMSDPLPPELGGGAGVGGGRMDPPHIGGTYLPSPGGPFPPGGSPFSGGGGFTNPFGGLSGGSGFDWKTSLSSLFGNPYLTGTGRWDGSNIAASLIQSMTNIPVNRIAEYMANASLKAGGDSRWIPNFLEKPAISHAYDNADNQAVLSERAFDRNMMQNEIRNGPSLASPFNPQAAFSPMGQSGWGAFNTSPITGLTNMGNPFAALNNSINPSGAALGMPTDFGPFNPASQQTQTRDQMSGRGDGGRGRFGADTLYGQDAIDFLSDMKDRNALRANIKHGQIGYESMR